jgi:hypothetical protein
MQGFLFGAAVSQEKALALLAAEEEAGLVALDAPLGHSQAPDLQAVLGAAQI